MKLFVNDAVPPARQNRGVINSVVRHQIISCFIVAAVAGCALSRTAPYDPQIDAGITDLHMETTAFLQNLERRLGTPDARHGQYVEFYDHVRVVLASLRLRADVWPENERTVEQIELLARSFAALEELHRDGIDDPTTLDTVRRQFDTAFQAIMRLELAKRRGP